MRFACRFPGMLRGGVAALVLLVAALAWSPATARADVVYTIDGDLSALSSGTAINLDFQFNPGVGTYDAATATVSGFTSTNLTLGSATDTGGGSGSLPSGITLNNSTGFNEVIQAATVGTNATFQFTLTLSGPAINSPSSTATAGTSFGLGVLDSNLNPFPQYGSKDPVLRIDINPGSGVPVISTVVTPPITIRTAGVPEPSGLAIGVMGIAGVWAGLSWRRRQSRTATAR